MWFLLFVTVLVGAVLYKLFAPGQKNIWEKYGVRVIDTSHVVTLTDALLNRKNLTDVDDYVYQEMGNDKFSGTTDTKNPVLLVKDVELLKKVLIKDADYFIDRRHLLDEEKNTLSNTLLSLKGDEWKGVRASVSPTFTTGKIRKMMECFNSVGKEWVEEFARKAKSSSNGSITIDTMSAVNAYTVEVISITVFGMKAGLISNPESHFGKMANALANFTKFQLFKLGIRINFPWLFKYLGWSLIDQESLNFFEKILEQGLKSRMSGEAKRNDFLQLLVQAKKGELKAADDSELSTFEKDARISAEGLQKKQYLTDEIMNAQMVSFFFAGFSTTSNAISFALYSLALNPIVQTKLREEVNKIVKEDGTLDYDDVGQLVYLDMVICEVLRKFPAAARLERLCVREYRDPEIGLVIPKGVMVGIPLNSIHHDRQYYDNPDNFDPEHFSPEKKAARSPYAYMPFGIGPRNCIGMRFAIIEVKSAIAHMVHNFVIEPTVMTPRPLHGAPGGLNLVPPKGLELKLTPINKK